MSTQFHDHTSPLSRNLFAAFHVHCASHVKDGKSWGRLEQRVIGGVRDGEDFDVAMLSYCDKHVKHKFCEDAHRLAWKKQVRSAIALVTYIRVVFCDGSCHVHSCRLLCRSHSCFVRTRTDWRGNSKVRTKQKTTQAVLVLLFLFVVRLLL
jgi:hypothetical protein